jgi:hypothetical protein
MLFKIHRIIGVIREFYLIFRFQLSEIIDNLFGNLNQNTYYPILKSDLRPAEDNAELSMVKIHAQLLEV